MLLYRIIHKAHWWGVPIVKSNSNGYFLTRIHHKSDIISPIFPHVSTLPLQPDGALSLTIYNGWPTHGPGNTQIFTRAETHGLQELLQRYMSCGKERPILDKILQKAKGLLLKVTSIEDSASPDGNALPLCATWFMTSAPGVLDACAPHDCDVGRAVRPLPASTFTVYRGHSEGRVDAAELLITICNTMASSSKKIVCRLLASRNEMVLVT
jgi:hypothetical protein